MLDYAIPWGFFDGPNPGNPPRCGVGVELFINANYYFHIRYAPSTGSNTKAEFPAMYSLFFFSRSHGLNQIHVLKYSQVVIDWENGKCKVEIMRTNPCSPKLCALFRNLNGLPFPISIES
jgi:hypothetical protein